MPKIDLQQEASLRFWLGQMPKEERKSIERSATKLSEKVYGLGYSGALEVIYKVGRWMKHEHLGCQDR